MLWLNATPLHTVAVGTLVIAGAGFTVTDKVCVEPVQLPVVAVGVIVYVTTSAELVLELVIVLFTVDELCVVKLSPVVLALLEAIQVKVEPVLPVSGKFSATPLQTEVELALVTTGAGLTVTVNVCGEPAQLFAVDVGVTVYVTVCAVVLLLLVMVLLMVLLFCVVKLSPVVLALSAATQEKLDAGLAVKP